LTFVVGGYAIKLWSSTLWWKLCNQIERKLFNKFLNSLGNFSVWSWRQQTRSGHSRTMCECRMTMKIKIKILSAPSRCDFWLHFFAALNLLKQCQTEKLIKSRMQPKQFLWVKFSRVAFFVIKCRRWKNLRRIKMRKWQNDSTIF
jgi:hypothetical protein